MSGDSKLKAVFPAGFGPPRCLVKNAYTKFPVGHLYFSGVAVSSLCGLKGKMS